MLFPGYREFCQYLDSPTDAAFDEAVLRMKISTRQYAKRQISWIRNKLIPAVNATAGTEQPVYMYLLDATGQFLFSHLLVSYRENLELGDDWAKNVQLPGTEILNGKSSHI